jgi:3-isopropylmalate/(R)-2-methylmalate dehydratase small subunit
VNTLTGNAWVFGDNIDTDLLAPGHAMRKPLEELAKHVLEAVAPGFASAVQRGDVIVAGYGFGIGSSREQAAQALLHLGVSAVLARSCARIFYRNAFNLGLPVLVFPEAPRVANGDRLSVELSTGRITNHTRNEAYECEPIPDFLLELVRDGGLISHLHRKLHPRAGA